MRKFILGGLAAVGTLALAACGGSDDASEDNTAESVEMPAQEALEPVNEAPVEDAEANTPAPAPAANDSQADLEAEAEQRVVREQAAVKNEADSAKEAAAAAAQDFEALAAEAEAAAGEEAAE